MNSFSPLSPKVLGRIPRDLSELLRTSLYGGFACVLLRIYRHAREGPAHPSRSSANLENDQSATALKMAGHFDDANEGNIRCHRVWYPPPLHACLLLRCRSGVHWEIWLRGSGRLCGSAPRLLLPPSKDFLYLWPKPEIQGLHGKRGFLLSCCCLWRLMEKRKISGWGLLPKHHGG